MKNKKRYCKPRVQDTCGPKYPLTCSTYQGILPRTESDLDECSSGEEVIEYLIESVDDIKEELDFTGFGCCIEFKKDNGEKVTIKDVVSHLSCRITDIEENCCTGEKPTNTESECKDCEDIKPTDKGLVFNTSGSGLIQLDSNFSQFSPINTYGLKYKTKVKGVYKITVEIKSSVFSGVHEDYSVGISIDGSQPDLGAFNQSFVSTNSTNSTITFLVSVDKGVNIEPVFKKAPTGVVRIQSVKEIIEKV